jgi:G3E family GTPase
VADAEAIRAKATERRKGEQVLRQLRTGDLVVLNKVDLLSPLERESIVDWLHEIAPEARLVETVHGRLAPALALGHHDAEAGPGTPYSAWTWLTVDPVDHGSFMRWLASLPRGVLRAEGVLYLKHDPAHRYRFHLIGARWTLQREAPWGAELPFTRLTVLGPPGAWDGAWMDVLAAERLAPR